MSDHSSGAPLNLANDSDALFRKLLTQGLWWSEHFGVAPTIPKPLGKSKPSPNIWLRSCAGLIIAGVISLLSLGAAEASLSFYVAFICAGMALVLSLISDDYWAGCVRRRYVKIAAMEEVRRRVLTCENCGHFSATKNRLWSRTSRMCINCSSAIGGSRRRQFR